MHEITNTSLGMQRTFLAQERTLLAWIRTSASLISFGFTIYKFFQYLSQVEGVQVHRRFGPRVFALGMISIGIVTLAFATVQHRQQMARLTPKEGAGYRSLAGPLAALLSIFGVAALIAVLL